MGYWILILFIFIILIIAICVTLYLFIKKKDMSEFCLGIFSIIIVLILSIYFGIDIPSAISGGQKLYVDRFPDIVPLMSLHIVYAGEQKFIDFSGCNPDNYEKNSNYCIYYTKFTKTILKIEKVE